MALPSPSRVALGALIRLYLVPRPPAEVVAMSYREKAEHALGVELMVRGGGLARRKGGGGGEGLAGWLQGAA